MKITSGWTINKHEFYDVDPLDNVPIEDKETLIFFVEDILWIAKGSYNLDLGWYGGVESKDGYCVVLYRGDSWNKCDLLEIFRSKNKNEITEKINTLIHLVDSGKYDSVGGYRIDDDDKENTNSVADFKTYTALK
jgi:hypothetical protein